MTKLFFALLLLSLGTSASAKDLSTKKTCLRAGGEWRAWSKGEGVKNQQSCRLRAKDAGQDCSDGSDCSLHRCEYDAQIKRGACSEFGQAAGCHSFMTKGKPGPVVCVD